MTDKRPVGRPSKYNEELQAKAEQYLYDFSEQGDVVPSQAGLCCWLGIVRSTLQEWDKIYPEFSATLGAISVKQENLALNRSLDGGFNSTIAKLLLANHGYSDAQKIDHTTNGKNISASGDAVLAALARKHSE